MKKLSFLFLFALSAAVSASGVLLQSTFDKYSTLPDRVKNPATQTTGIPHDLQLRMKQGPANKNNAVELHNREFIRYTGKGNFNAQCGTVSFWVKPLNWKIHGGSDTEETPHRNNRIRGCDESSVSAEFTGICGNLAAFR